MVIHDVAAEQAARIREPIGKMRALGVEQQADRLDRRGAQEHNAGLVFGVAQSVRVDDAHAADASARGVVGQFRGDAVRTQRQIPGRVRGRKRRSVAVEVGVGDAAAVAGAAVVAGRAAVVILRQNGHASDGHDAFAIEGLQDPFPRGALDAGHLHGRQELTVGQLRKPFACARHADESLHVRVPGSDVLVADRPIIAVAILCVRLEIQVAPAIDLPSPGDGAAPDLAAAKPAERRPIGMRVWVLEIVDEEFVPELVAGVAIGLYRALTLQGRAIAPTAKRDLVGLYVFDKILGGIDRAAGLEHQGLEPRLREFLGSPTPRDTGADHDGVEIVLLFHLTLGGAIGTLGS